MFFIDIEFDIKNIDDKKIDKLNNKTKNSFSKDRVSSENDFNKVYTKKLLKNTQEANKNQDKQNKIYIKLYKDEDNTTKNVLDIYDFDVINLFENNFCNTNNNISTNYILQHIFNKIKNTDILNIKNLFENNAIVKDFKDSEDDIKQKLLSILLNSYFSNIEAEKDLTTKDEKNIINVSDNNFKLFDDNKLIFDNFEQSNILKENNLKIKFFDNAKYNEDILYKDYQKISNIENYQNILKNIQTNTQKIDFKDFESYIKQKFGISEDEKIQAAENAENKVDFYQSSVEKVLDEVDIKNFDFVKNLDYKERKSVVDQICERIESHSKFDLSSIKIKLKPENLGNVSLKIFSKDGLISATFIANNIEIKNIIQSNFDILKNVLNNKGIEINAFSVSVGEESSDKNFGDDFKKNNKQNKKTNKILRQEDKILKNEIEDAYEKNLYNNNIDFSA